MEPVKELLREIIKLIVNPVIVLGFVVATIYFFYSIIKFIWGADGKDLETNKKCILYGILGLFFMFSVYGILRIVLATLGIPYPSFFP